jgi:SAM-dependent methyltransferase
MDDRINNFFTGKVKQYGLHDARSVVWISDASMTTRFRVLAEVTDLKNKTVLDVGSGLGDLYAFLKPFNVKYTGIELSEEMAEASKKKYQEIQVIHDNFFSHDFSDTFQIVLCSGAFNIRYPYHDEYVKRAIRKMWNVCSEAVAFNLPSALYEDAKFSPPFEEGMEIAYMNPEEILKFCKTLCPQATLRHDYLPHDFTIYMYRD